MIQLNSALLFQRTLEELASLFTIYGPRVAILEVQMDIQMDWFPCLGFSMRQRDIATKEAVGEKERLPYISSLGILILKNSYSSGKTTVRKSPEHVTCSMLFGSPIFS